MRSKRGDAHRDGRLDVTSEGVDMSINIIKCGGNAGGRGEGGKMKTKLVPISFRKKGDGTGKKGTRERVERVGVEREENRKVITIEVMDNMDVANQGGSVCVTNNVVQNRSGPRVVLISRVAMRV